MSGWRELVRALGGGDDAAGGPIRPISDSHMNEIEARIGIAVPNQLRSFLLEYGSIAFNEEVCFPQASEELRGVLAEVSYFFGSDGPAGDGRFSIVSGHRNYVDNQRVPRELLPFATNMSHSLLCIGVEGEYLGKVFFWDADMEPELDDFDPPKREKLKWSNVYSVCSTFSDFMNSLSIVPD